MNALVPVPIGQAAASQLMRQRVAAQQGNNNSFASNVAESFPTLSIKGKVFTAKIAGQQQTFMDPNTRTPLAYLDIILVEGSPLLAKSYYAKGYTEGDVDTPNCWSLDSIRPDPSVPHKQSPVCGTCPMNQFGSRIAENGKPAKMCSDYRRIAVTLPHMLDGTTDVMTFLMKIPQSSLKNLKAHADLLQRHQFEPRGCVTRVTFDHQEAYPKLLFNFVNALSDPQYQNVLELSASPNVEAMLRAPDFENAPSTHPVQTDSISGMTPQTPPVLGTQPVAQPQASFVPPAYKPSAFHDASTQPAPAPTLQPTAAAHIPPVQQVQPTVKAVPSTLIELPDGKLFDPATGQYVERPQPQVQMPVLDPDVIKLPDGKFFNKATGQYVNGPEVGSQEPAPVVTTKPARAPRKKAEPAAAPTTAEAQAAPVQGEVIPPTNGAADVQPTVASAPRSMDEILMGLGKPTN